MEIIIYILIFIIGATLGSFFTLATYRIPLNQDITHKRSYCPNCNHKLGFFDLIPILSYIFLKGKCRYCKEKIHPRYLIFEIISGIVFLCFTLLINFNIYNLEINKIVYWFYGMFFISTVFIILGIIKEHKQINKSVILFGTIVEILYIIYLYTLKVSIYKYVIFEVIIYLVILIQKYLLKNQKNINYVLDVLILILYLIIGIIL